jgi:predicted ATP-grasp superfamily ATP-dependent carboligase
MPGVTEERSLGAGALVVGGDYQGLGIVRSLGRMGFRVCVVDDEPSIAGFSRYATHSIRVADLHDEETVIETLLAIGRRLGLEGWVVFATRDELVAALAKGRERLATFFRVPTPAWETVRYAADKRLTYELAEKLDIPLPQTWYPSSLEELDAIQPRRWPLLIKPAIKEHFIYSTRVKGWVVGDREELRKRFEDAKAIVPVSEVMVQDMIPGNGSTQFSYCAFFKSGRSVARMTVQRQRQRPSDLGRSSTFVKTVEQSELAAPSERFLHEIDYYGLAELEYKLDEADGQFKLLDVNTRTWGYHSVGYVAGVDFPLLLQLDQLGIDVAEAQARSGISWVRLITDLPTAAPELLRRRLAFRDYVRSLRGIRTEAVFARDDLKPAFAEFLLLPHLVRTRMPTRRWR